MLGSESVATLAGPGCDPRGGLAQGFERYFDEFEAPEQRQIELDHVQRSGSEVIDTALAWAGEDDTTLKMSCVRARECV